MKLYRNNTRTVKRYARTYGVRRWPLRVFMISANVVAGISPFDIFAWKNACRWYSFSKSWNKSNKKCHVSYSLYQQMNIIIQNIICFHGKLYSNSDHYIPQKIRYTVYKFLKVMDAWSNITTGSFDQWEPMH